MNSAYCFFRLTLAAQSFFFPSLLAVVALLKWDAAALYVWQAFAGIAGDMSETERFIYEAGLIVVR